MPWGGHYVSILKQYCEILLYIDKAVRAPILYNSKTLCKKLWKIIRLAYSDADILLTDMWKFKGWICFDFVLVFYVMTLSFQICRTSILCCCHFLNSHLRFWVTQEMAAVPHSAFEYRVYMGAVPLESLHDEIRRGKCFVDLGINTTCWVEEVWFVKQKTCSLLTGDDFWNWNPSCVQML